MTSKSSVGLEQLLGDIRSKIWLCMENWPAYETKSFGFLIPFTVLQLSQSLGLQETAAALINAFATVPIDYCKCLYVSPNVVFWGFWVLQRTSAVAASRQLIKVRIISDSLSSYFFRLNTTQTHAAFRSHPWSLFGETVLSYNLALCF